MAGRGAPAEAARGVPPLSHASSHMLPPTGGPAPHLHPGVQHPGARAGADPAANDLEYLDAVERTLVESIARLTRKLGESRDALAGRAPQRRVRRTRRSPGRTEWEPVAGGTQRVITVSLYLPTKEDRESCEQKFVDARLPPKGMYALEKASDLNFVWVGAPDPAGGGAGSPEAFEETYGVARGVGRVEESVEGFEAPAAHVVPVTLPAERELLEAYSVYCDRTLYHLLHYDYSSLATDEEMGEAEHHWNAYRVVNQRFAETVSEIYEEGDLIWVHNYHLMLVPNMLRRRLWFAKIGFFLYSPFPSAELFRILPNRVHVLRGVLGSDLVGFHTYDYSKQFAASCTRLLGVEGNPVGIQVEPRSTRKCEFGIYPAGIDVRSLKVRVGSAKVVKRIASLRRRFGTRKIIVGIDRLDDAFAGIPLKLLAFERFLADNEKWRGKVALVQVATLPKQAPRTKVAHIVQINEFVARINSMYGTLADSPVHYINEELDPVDIHALMCVGHVCMISVIRDGMGLVPYEWTVCQHGGYKGCLILSEFAGAAPSFSTALHVNPWNVDDVAIKIRQALQMSDGERATRDAAAYNFVTTHTASLWGLNFLDDLEQLDSRAEAPGAMSAPSLDVQVVLDAFLHRTPSRNSSSASISSLHGQHSRKTLAMPTPNAMRTPKPSSPVQSGMAASAPSPPPLRVSRSSPSYMHDLSAGGRGGLRRVPASSPVPIAGSHGPQTTASPGASPYMPAQRRPMKKKKVFVLDYDGTLVQSQALAEHVAPSQQLLQLLRDLSSLENTFVVLLSGRKRSTLTHWFGDLDVFLAAEDGSFLRCPGDSAWVALFRRTAADDYGVRSHHGDGYSVTPTTPGPPGSVSGFGGSDRGLGGMMSMAAGLSDAGSGYGDATAKGSEKSGYAASVMSPRHASAPDPVVSIEALDAGLPRAASNTDASSLPDGESSGHPLHSARHRWSMSSMGSQGGESANVPEWKNEVMPIMHHFAERTPGVILEEGDATLTWHFNDADTDFGRLQARDLQKQLESFLLQKFSIEVVADEGCDRFATRWVKVRPAGVDKSVVIERVLDVIRNDSAVSSASGSTNSVNMMGSGMGSSGLGVSMVGMSTFSPGFVAASVLKAARETGSSPMLDMDGGGLGGSTTSAGKDKSSIDFFFAAGDDRADEGMFEALNDDSKLDSMGLASLSTKVFTCRIGTGPTSAAAVLESPQKLLDLLEEICRKHADALNGAVSYSGQSGTGSMSSTGPQPVLLPQPRSHHHHHGSW